MSFREITIKKTQINTGRRQLLAWSTPTIVAIALPVHAQMSICPDGPPLLNVLVAPKCSGSPPIGTAELQLLAPSATTITLMNISTSSNDPNSTLAVNESLPRDITQSINTTITWEGPASDAQSCLPLAELMVMVEYQCSDGEIEMETYDILALLTAAD